jgi:hypothetical protein
MKPIPVPASGQMLAGSKTGAIIQRIGITVPGSSEDNRVSDATRKSIEESRIAV